ncbi:Gfo/Idh/MocA family oxidoreductase [Streptomyces prunicolor]|uniref:Gfo/Idh/MocA family protein n=1 Tax=Streptomyces prunicolor TaxID=67348 RepID=UPI00225123A4|nr:Gfo/Idh/MocA family oxidoreductase [Streptomyces prunicolor]MCX5240297.1 Gfo/Idh/MocA family oxidoreductase [Streptomyces prunicolor]
MAQENTRHRIGILGAGNIFGRYVEGLRKFPELEVVRVADIDPARAKQAAAEFGIPEWGDAAALLADDSVEIIINITPPQFHAKTTIAALEAGKHVYAEKPLAVTVEEGRSILEAAARTDRLLGSAPDTFLGSAVQTARHAIDAGLIGEVVGTTAFVRSSRAETWHPDPRSFFQPGAGPVFDMGPYYLAALINCLGPVSSLSAATRIGAKTREVTSPDRVVDEITVEVPTHASAVLTFTSGAIGTVLMSFDVWDTELPRIEIYGTEGTLALPNPNFFDGDVRIKRHQDTDWEVLTPVTELFGAVGTPEQHRRGLGVQDLVGALTGEPHRANAQFAFHTLEVLASFEISQQESRVVALESSCERPAPRYAH